MTDPKQILLDIVSEYERNKFITLSDSRTHFSHYTSSFAAMQIMKNKKIWMRNSSVMNDHSEIKYGEQLLKECLKHTNLGRRLKIIFNKIDEKIYEKISINLDKYENNRLNSTYIFSISEHNAQEDLHGRLSMWRAYGGDNGVALILNRYKINLFTQSDLTVMPVLYADSISYRDFFRKFVDRIEKDIEKIKGLNPDLIVEIIWNYFQYIIMSTKHPGFNEEREWRIIHLDIYKAKNVLESVETINGIPQIIFNIDIPGALGMPRSPSNLGGFVEKIIIGPTINSNIIYNALLTEIKKIYSVDPKERIIQSNIPLRR